MTAVLGEAQVTVAELLDLEVGDYIALDSPVGDVIPILVGRVPSFTAARAVPATAWRWRSSKPPIQRRMTTYERRDPFPGRNRRPDRGGSKAQEEAELPKESGEPAEEFDASAIGEILRLAMSATVEGLAIMTDAEGRLESKGVHRTTLEELREDLSTGLVAVQYELAGALDGILISLFPAQSAGTLNEIVRGGDAPEGGDDDLSGFREVVAEMALHLSDAFTSALDARVEVAALEPEQVVWHEESEPPLPVAADEDVVVAEFELFIGDATCTVVHLIPADVTGGIGGVFAREEHLAGSEEVAAAQEPLESPPLKEPATGVRRSGGRGLARRGPGSSGKIAPAQFEELGRERPLSYPRNIDLLLDVPLQVTVELGRTRMPNSRGPRTGQRLHYRTGETRGRARRGVRERQADRQGRGCHDR